MCLHCFYYYVVALIYSKYHNVRKFLINRLRSLKIENKNKKNKKLNISLFRFEISLRIVLKKITFNDDE